MGSIGRLGRKPCGLLLLGVGFLWISMGAASAEWEAQATSTLNLRVSPGIDQKILTVLTPGAAVVVTEQQGEWCKVVGKDAPEVQGWVVAAYLKKTTPDEQAASPGSAQKEVEKVVPEKGMHPPQEAATPAPESANEPSAPAAGQEVPEIKKAEGIETTSSPLRKDAPGVGASEPARVPSLETAGEASKTAAADTPDALSGLSLMLRQVVQLASVIMSCLALVFSYKAFQLAQECYRAMMRFQLRFQQTQEKAGKSAKE
jgi:uncharacterized protein YraI